MKRGITEGGLSKSKTSSLSFGPQIEKIKQVESIKNVRKLVHYDCNDFDGNDEEIPNEDEIYIKENLLNKLGDNPNEYKYQLIQHGRRAIYCKYQRLRPPFVRELFK